MLCYINPLWPINTLRPRQNGCHFADDIAFKSIFLNENVRISIKISLKFVPKGPIDNNPTLFQIMAWHRSGDKPLSEPMIVSLLTHICVTRPQWVNTTRWHKSELTLAQVIGLLSDGPEPMLTNHQWSLVAFLWDQFYIKCSRYLALISGWNYYSTITVLYHNYSHNSQGPMS